MWFYENVPKVGDRFLSIDSLNEAEAEIVVVDVDIHAGHVTLRDEARRTILVPFAWPNEHLYPIVPTPKWIQPGNEVLFYGEDGYHLRLIKRVHEDWVYFSGPPVQAFSKAHVLQVCRDGRWVPRVGDRIVGTHGHVYVRGFGDPVLSYYLPQDPTDRDFAIQLLQYNGISIATPELDLLPTPPKHPWVESGVILRYKDVGAYRVLQVGPISGCFSAKSLQTQKDVLHIDWALGAGWSLVPSKWDAEFSIGLVEHGTV